MRGDGFGSAGPERRSDNGMAAQFAAFRCAALDVVDRLELPIELRENPVGCAPTRISLVSELCHILPGETLVKTVIYGDMASDSSVTISGR